MASVLARASLPAMSAVLLFAVLAEALHRTRGHYKTNRVLFVTLALGLFAITCARARPIGTGGPGLRRALVALALLGTSLLALDSRLLFASPSDAQEGLRFLCIAAWLAVVVATVMVFRARAAGATQAVLLVAAVALVVARPLVLFASPAPHIDVFTTTDRAVDYLLAGTNPYGAAYPDIYEGRFDYAPGLVYWPGTVVFAALGKLAFGDLRWAWLLGDLAVAGLLAALGLRDRDPERGTTAALAAVAWLAFPVGLFVLEQAWVDPLVLAFVIGGALALDARRLALAGVLFGLAAATKQPAALAATLAAGLSMRAGLKGGLRFVGPAALVFGLLVAPFAAADPQGLLTMTITVPLGQAMRPDSLSLVAYLQRELGLGWPGAASAAVYGGLLLWMGGRGWRRRADAGSVAPVARLLPDLALLYGVVFLLGKQAFCNYWSFAAGLVLAARLAASEAQTAESREQAHGADVGGQP